VTFEEYWSKNWTIPDTPSTAGMNMAFKEVAEKAFNAGKADRDADASPGTVDRALGAERARG